MGAAGHADPNSTAPEAPPDSRSAEPRSTDPDAPTLLDPVVPGSTRRGSGDGADAPTLLVTPPTLTEQRTSPESSRLSNSLAGSRSGTEPKRLGPYEVLSELGRGGMGLVFRARHVELEREVALKTLTLDGSEEALLRFRSEAQTMARLRHDNIVPIHDVGEDQGTLYLSMDLVSGGSLHDRLKAEGPLEAKEAARLAAGLARGLEHAHAKSIIHRDMKPANVLLDEQGRPLITDFGLARSLQAGGLQLSRTGALLGTPAYMPPEQVEGDRARVDERADIYALGATLYQMVTGRPPFSGATMEALLLRILTDDPEPPGSAGPVAIPRDLETIILKCLEKPIEQRYASAGALADDLERFLRGDPISARRTGLAERLLRKARRHRPALAGAAVVVLSLIFGARQAVRALRAEKTARALGAEGTERPGASFSKLARKGPDGEDLLAFDTAALALAAGGGLDDAAIVAARECAEARAALRAMSASRLDRSAATPEARLEAEKTTLSRVTTACDQGRLAGLPTLPLKVLEIDQQIAARDTRAACELTDEAFNSAPTSTLLLKVQARVYLTRSLYEPWILEFAEKRVTETGARRPATPARPRGQTDDDFWPGSKAQRAALLEHTLNAVVRARRVGVRFSLAEERLIASLEAFARADLKAKPADTEALEASAAKRAGDAPTATPPGFPAFVVDALLAEAGGQPATALERLDAGLASSPHCVEGLIQRGMVRAIRLPGKSSSLFDPRTAWQDFSDAAILARTLSQPRLGIVTCAIACRDVKALNQSVDNLLETLKHDFYDDTSRKRIASNVKAVQTQVMGWISKRAARRGKAGARPRVGERVFGGRRGR